MHLSGAPLKGGAVYPNAVEYDGELTSYGDRRLFIPLRLASLNPSACSEHQSLSDAVARPRLRAGRFAKIGHAISMSCRSSRFLQIAFVVA